MLLVSLSNGSQRCGPRAGRKYATWLLVALLGLLGALLAGCTTAQRCEPLQRCGGELVASGETVSSWVARADGACTDEIQAPVIPVSLSQQPAPGAGKKAVGNSTVDWCASLSAKPDGQIKNFVNYSLSFVLPVKQAELQFKSDGTYFAHFRTESPTQVGFSAACRAAQGINWSCAELGRHINAAIVSESNVKYMRCSDDGDGGCLCDSLLSIFTSLQGVYGADNGVITFYDVQSNAPPSPADYCAKPDSFSLTGHDGQALFNRLGLRTVAYGRASCSDGLQDADEDGIDCTTASKRANLGAAACPNDCTASCIDNIQNQDETGVDCGGTCADFCACFNGVQDPWEEGVDCGGPCALLCTCTDGVQDGHEEGVDCGGDCNLRYGAGSEIPKACPTK